MSEVLRDGGPVETHAPVPATPAGSKPLGGLVGAGLRWSLATQVGLRAATFLSGVVLARILVPEDFGVYAVALAAINLLLSISDAGLILAVIQWRGDLEEVKSTAFTLTLTVSVGLYLLCFALAGPFAELMGSPQAVGVLRLMALAVVMDGFTAVPAATLHRAFRQDRMAIAELAAVPVNIGVSVVLAVLGAGAWSLAWGRLAGGLVSTSLVLLLASFRPRFGFDPALARTLLRFGLPLATTLLIEAALLNLDYVVVGHLLGPTALGFYLLAFNVSSWPISVIRATVRRVSIAGFSRLQGDEEALAAGFARSFGLLMTVTVPVALLLALLAPPLIRFVYGERWSAAADVLRFLAVLGGVRVATSLVFDVLVASGRPRAPLWLQLTWLAALAPALVAGTRLDGIRGTAVAHAVVGITLVLPLFLLALRPLGVSLTRIARELARPAAAALLASIVCLGLLQAFRLPLAQLVVAGGGAASAYALVVVPLDRIRHYLRRRASIPGRHA
ncbi:MAG: lipopolysaccharide biosynthesis protein, partial [Actinomycetota bacterium]|nr:lipopolysaccharide biosynthesis protein [Actinomycetota bacterium]